MKHFPSITRDIRKKTPIYAFSKLDGSSCAAEFNRKQGWYKFGTRKRLLTSDLPQAKAIDLFKEKYGDALTAVLKKERWDRVTVYFEFWGPNSFAGQHDAKDSHTVTLFDVSVHKKGILLPKTFLDVFGHLDHANLLYHGNVTDELVEKVRTCTLEQMPLEGIVCKGEYITPGMPLMFKIKSDAWINKLKEYCAGNLSLFNELL